MLKSIKVFSKSEYFKTILGQVGIVLIAQLIPILCSPLIARLYGEKAIAEVTGLISLASILLVFNSLKMGQAIVIEKDDNKAKQLVVLIVFLISIITLIISVILFVFKDFFVSSFEVNNVIFYVPIYIFSFGVFSTLDFWFIRIKKFKYKAYSKIIEAIVYIVFALTLYFSYGKNEMGLAIGKLLGVVSATLFLIYLSHFQIPKFNFNELKELLTKYKEFPIHVMPSTFINVLSIQIIIIFLGLYFTKEEVGFFGLANMVILVPTSFIGQTISNIFFQKIVEDVNRESYKNVFITFKKTVILLSTFSFPGFLILYFFSTEIFTFVFGENWNLTGLIAKELAVIFLIQIVVSPVSSTILIPLGKAKLNAMWQYGRFVFMLISLLVMTYIMKLDFLPFVKGYSYCVAFAYIIYFIIVYNIVKKQSLK
ncbi:oligosaccharide flippase family protein [Cellulophaga sp. HaHa_2_95]|uniref:oligosaccharide flippase family protein n=1 Tax=Cellulophaga TaxID=104264 RepID=UPI001C4F3F76|nr:oligosaccharide flippase family protein [Cellulophaga sp. HaHa_2_95]QXP55243.1 oligosaccharide flippase family protein [Cellulophaga sp. HaHa_2_95]